MPAVPPLAAVAALISIDVDDPRDAADLAMPANLLCGEAWIARERRDQLRLRLAVVDQD